eukprot:5818910-Amphidinium_carterae.3
MHTQNRLSIDPPSPLILLEPPRSASGRGRWRGSGVDDRVGKSAGKQVIKPQGGVACRGIIVLTCGTQKTCRCEEAAQGRGLPHPFQKLLC